MTYSRGLQAQKSVNGCHMTPRRYTAFPISLAVSGHWLRESSMQWRITWFPNLSGSTAALCSLFTIQVRWTTPPQLCDYSMPHVPLQCGEATSLSQDSFHSFIFLFQKKVKTFKCFPQQAEQERMCPCLGENFLNNRVNILQQKQDLLENF